MAQAEGAPVWAALRLAELVAAERLALLLVGRAVLLAAFPAALRAADLAVVRAKVCASLRAPLSPPEFQERPRRGAEAARVRLEPIASDIGQRQRALA